MSDRDSFDFETWLRGQAASPDEPGEGTSPEPEAPGETEWPGGAERASGSEPPSEPPSEPTPTETEPLEPQPASSEPDPLVEPAPTPTEPDSLIEPEPMPSEPEPLIEPEPTVAMTRATPLREDDATRVLRPHPGPPAADAELAGQEAPTEVIGRVGDASVAPSGVPRSGDALESLFGDEKFREYTEPSTENPFAPRQVPPDAVDAAPAEISRAHRIMLWSAGGFVALLALIALFVFGTRLPDLMGWNNPAESTPDNPIISGEGPVAPGEYNWAELLGGECLEPYPGAWADDYTVVDCSVPHTAQLIVRGTVPIVEGSGGAYPGVAELTTRMNLLCTDGAVLDYDVAGQYDDLQFEASFPASEEEWNDGQRDYFCFVSLASGDPLTGSLVASPDAEATDPATGD